MVITGWNSNPVQAVLYLVLVFINSSGLLILLEVEYMALIFTMVYVGAIAILFLFVIMMLDIKLFKTRDYFQIYPISFVVFCLFFSVMVYSLSDYKNVIVNENYYKLDFINYVDNFNILSSLGQYLYSYGVFYFLTAGIALLLAMLGCISLTHIFKNNKLYGIYSSTF